MHIWSGYVSLLLACQASWRCAWVRPMASPEWPSSAEIVLIYGALTFTKRNILRYVVQWPVTGDQAKDRHADRAYSNGTSHTQSLVSYSSPLLMALLQTLRSEYHKLKFTIQGQFITGLYTHRDSRGLWSSTRYGITLRTSPWICFCGLIWVC